MATGYATELGQSLEGLEANTNAEREWSNLKSCVCETAELCIPEHPRKIKVVLSMETDIIEHGWPG